MSSSSIPHEAPEPGPPRPVPGSPGAGSPTSTVHSVDSDSSPSVPPRFVTFARRDHRCAPLRSPGSGPLPRGLDCFYRGARAAFFAMEKTRPPRFLGDPCLHAPLFDPGGPSVPGHPGTGDAAFRLVNDVGSALRCSRGSITRPAGSLCTLRSRGRPQTTQHSVPAGGQPLPGQDLHLLGRIEGFCLVCPST